MPSGIYLLYLRKPLLISRERFLRLITEAAIFGREIRQYTRTLRQMAALLSASTVAADLSQKAEIVESEDEEGVDGGEPSTTEAVESMAPPNGDQTAETSPTNKQKQAKRKRKKNKGNLQQVSDVRNCLKDGGDVGEDAAGVNGEIATLAKLQSYFRIRNGFTMLESQMKVGIF